MSKSPCKPCPPKPLSSCGPIISDLECKIIQMQIARRAKYRMEFLKQRTDPCKHSLESGYVFDLALQRYITTKSTQFETFLVNPRTITSGFLALLPMFLYGALVWKDRNDREKEYRCGRIRYKDRLFRLC